MPEIIVLVNFVGIPFVICLCTFI